MDPADLEALIDRELKRLPAPRAPHTLLPRALAAADVWSRRPWYTRGWTAWPFAWQLISVSALVLVAAAMAAFVPAAQAYVTSLVAAAAASDVVRETLAGAQRAAAAAGAMQIVWTTLIEPLAVYLVLLAGLLYMTCVAFGLALERVASGRALSS